MTIEGHQIVKAAFAEHCRADRLRHEASVIMLESGRLLASLRLRNVDAVVAVTASAQLKGRITVNMYLCVQHTLVS